MLLASADSNETQDRVALITGTASDIGKVAAKLFGREDVQHQWPLLIASGVCLARSARSSSTKTVQKSFEPATHSLRKAYWWRRRESNRRRQPFHCVAIPYIQQLAGCERLRKFL